MRRSLLQRFQLPAWARHDNPLVRRELQALPLFLGQDGNLSVKRLLLAVLALGLMPCSCSCGGLPWLVLQSALSLAPLLWGALLINREQAAGTWDVLRVTPYSDAELVLAKISAVVYRLSPLLTLLLSGQLAYYLILGFFTSFTLFSATLTVNGMTAWQTATTPSGAISALLALLLALAAIVLTTILDFATNIVLGTLASSLASSRGTAYAGAIGLRLLLSLVWLGLGALVIGIIAPEAPLEMSVILSAVQPPAWLILAAPASAGPVILIACLMLAIQGALLIGLFQLVVWRIGRA